MDRDGWFTAGGSSGKADYYERPKRVEIKAEARAAAKAKVQQAVSKSAAKAPQHKAKDAQDQQKKKERRERQKARRAEESSSSTSSKRVSLSKTQLARLAADIDELPERYDNNPGAVWEQCFALFPTGCDDTDSDEDVADVDEEVYIIDAREPAFLSDVLVNTINRAVLSDATQMQIIVRQWVPRLVHSAFHSGTGNRLTARSCFILQQILRSNAACMTPKDTAAWLKKLTFPPNVVLWIFAQIAYGCADNAFGIMVEYFMANSDREGVVATYQPYLPFMLDVMLETDIKDAVRGPSLTPVALRDLFRIEDSELFVGIEDKFSEAAWRFLVSKDVIKFLPTLVQVLGAKTVLDTSKAMANSILLRTYLVCRNDANVKAKWSELAEKMPREMAIFSAYAKSKRTSMDKDVMKKVAASGVSTQPASTSSGSGGRGCCATVLYTLFALLLLLALALALIPVPAETH
eukprot:PhM_4_TR15232/c0_g1_i1/m.39682